MPLPKVGILHPGEMGISVAAAVQKSGYCVCWASQGRSSQTAARAAKMSLTDLKTLKALCQECSILLSVCPPHCAEELASLVCQHAFAGVYLDANAISPQKMKRIAQKMEANGARCVDGGIIGEPAWRPGTTWLYLSGGQAQAVAVLFEKGLLETHVMGADIGKASALKMCFAANTKGITALLCAIVGAAESLGVREALFAHWSAQGPGFALPLVEQIPRSMPKAWRFAGEMEEIAETFKEAAMPHEFYMAAAQTYHRLQDFKEKPAPSLEAVLAVLLENSSSSPE